MAIDVISDTTGKAIAEAIKNLAGSGTGSGASLEVVNLEESENYTITYNGVQRSNAYGFRKYGKLVVMSFIGAANTTIQSGQTIIRGLPKADRDIFSLMTVGDAARLFAIKSTGEVVYKGSENISSNTLIYINASYLTNEE